MQQHDLRLRRLRLISDVLEDYQDNMNRVFRLIEMEAGLDVDNVGSRHGASREASREREPRRHSETTNMRFFNRAVGGLTTEQILQFMTPVAYDATMNETRCPITWETFSPGQELLRVNTCNHIFSREAIIEWFGRNRHCPVCRSNPFSLSHSSTPPAQSNTMPSSPYNVLGYSAVVSLESFDPSLNAPTEDPSGSTHSGQPASQPSTSSNFVNALLRGLVNNINESVNPNTDYYEREFTFNVNDLLNLSADALVNEASRALSSYSSASSARIPNRDGDSEYNELP